MGPVYHEFKLTGCKLKLRQLFDKKIETYYHIFMRMRIIPNQSAKLPSYPPTRQRDLLMDIIRQSEGHIDAKELYRMASARDDTISTATVYRNLHLFKELGLIDEKRLGQLRCSYEIKRAGEHQHLVCSQCGKVADFECPLNELVQKVKKEHGFSVTKAELYLEGLCSDCTPRGEN